MLCFFKSGYIDEKNNKLMHVYQNRLISNEATQAAHHAITHCQRTMPAAHFAPSSRFTDATAATQGVYNRQKTSIHAAEIAAVEHL